MNTDKIKRYAEYCLERLNGYKRNKYSIGLCFIAERVMLDDDNDITSAENIEFNEIVKSTAKALNLYEDCVYYVKTNGTIRQMHNFSIRMSNQNIDEWYENRVAVLNHIINIMETKTKMQLYAELCLKHIDVLKKDFKFQGLCIITKIIAEKHDNCINKEDELVFDRIIVNTARELELYTCNSNYFIKVDKEVENYVFNYTYNHRKYTKTSTKIKFIELWYEPRIKVLNHIIKSYERR